MADIFNEVDEDLRRDRYKALWGRFGKYVIAVAVLIVAVTGGYRGWQAWQQSQADAAGDQFLSALDLSDKGEHSEAESALADIALEGSGNYPVLARFRMATEKQSTGNLDGARADFDILSADQEVPDDLRNIASIRAAALLVDNGDFDGVNSRVGKLAEGSTTWRHPAREFLGLAAWKSGNLEDARRWFSTIRDDIESPADVRRRADIALAVIVAAKGGEPEKNKGATQ